MDLFTSPPLDKNTALKQMAFSNKFCNQLKSRVPIQFSKRKTLPLKYRTECPICFSLSLTLTEVYQERNYKLIKHIGPDSVFEWYFPTRQPHGRELGRHLSKTCPQTFPMLYHFPLASNYGFSVNKGNPPNSQETLSTFLSINVTYCLDRAANIPLG
jgi:hypothetical protein